MSLPDQDAYVQESFGVDGVVARASAALFGKPLVTNIFRAVLVEAMLAEALAPDWRWCSADYSSWDFENAGGVRLEVKQSAARQSWAETNAPASKCSFDIAARTGRYEGTTWIEEAGRAADVYVFAHHSRIDPLADHRDPDQWRFYVVAAGQLPPTSRISLSNVQRLTEPLSLAAVRPALAAALDDLRNPARSIDEDPT